MAKGTEFFDVASFLRRIATGDMPARAAATAGYRTALMLGMTTRMYLDVRRKFSQGYGDDPVFGLSQMNRWCQRLLRMMKVERHIVGAFHAIPTCESLRSGDSRGTLIVCNHRSWLDVAVVGSLVPTYMVGNAMASSWPVFGHGGTMVGILYVDRTSKESRRDIQRQVREKLEAGLPVLNFPEGADFPGPGMAPFKPALFNVVAGQEFDILPMTVLYPPFASLEWVGDNPERLSNGDVAAGGSRISFIEHAINTVSNSSLAASIHFSEPIDCSSHNDPQALISHVRERMLGDLERPLPW